MSLFASIAVLCRTVLAARLGQIKFCEDLHQTSSRCLRRGGLYRYGIREQLMNGVRLCDKYLKCWPSVAVPEIPVPSPAPARRPVAELDADDVLLVLLPLRLTMVLVSEISCCFPMRCHTFLMSNVSFSLSAALSKHSIRGAFGSQMPPSNLNQ